MVNGKHITAVLGPKGGVGKSTISANLAIALSHLGKRVVAVDLDMGASNLHAMFGLRNPPKSLSDFIQNRVKNLSDVISDTSIANLGVVCGGDDPGIANIPYQKKMKLIRHLSSLDCDRVILDTAPGTAFNVLDFSIIARQTLLVTTGEVPSLLNLYSFIKSALFRRMTFFFKRHKWFELLELLDQAKDTDTYPHLRTMEGFFCEVQKVNAAAAESARKIAGRLRPFVVVNRVRTDKDARTGSVMKKLLKEYLSIEVPLIMTIRDDHAVGDAIAKLTPLMVDAPHSPFSKDIQKMASRVC